MSDRFQLALARPSPDPYGDPEVHTVADFLAARRGGGTDWEPNLDSSILSLVVDGRERLGTETSPSGQVDRLAAQFVPARRRIEAGEMALIRFADYHQVGEYLLLEPQGDRIAVSKFDLTEDPPMYYYPVPDSDWSRELFDYVRANRGRLSIEVGPVEVDRDMMLEALEREARLAAELYRELGVAPEYPILPA